MIQYNKNIGINIKNPTSSFHIVGTNSNASNISLFVQSASQSIFIIKNDGKIGLFTENPVYNFDVNGTSNFQNNMSFGSSGDIASIAWGGNGLSIYSKTTHGLGLGSNNILNRLFIATSGNVGIGTITPTAKLHIVNTASSVDVFKVTNSIGDYVLNNYTFDAPSSFLVRASGYLLLSAFGGPVNFSIDNGVSNAMNINTSGNVGIGTISSSSRFTIKANGTSSNNIIFNIVNDVGTQVSYISEQGYLYTTGRLYFGSNLNSVATNGISSIQTVYHYMLGQIQFIPNNGMTQGGIEQYMNPNGGMNIGLGSRVADSNTLATYKLIVGTIASSIYPMEVLAGTSISARFDGRVIGVTAINNNEYITLGQLTSSNYFIQNGNSFGATALLGTNDNQNLQFETNGITRLTIATSGNIGFGTSTPQYTLDVIGSGRFTNTLYTDVIDIFGGILNLGWNAATNSNFIKVASGDNRSISIGASPISGGSGWINFITNGLERVVVTKSGNVGIGTSSPTYRLDVVSATSISARFDGRVIGVTAVNNNEFITLGQLASSASNYFIQNGNSFGANAVLGTNDNQALQLETNGTTRLTIATNGNIGIGTETPIHTLDVNGNTKVTALVITDGSTVINRDVSYLRLHGSSGVKLTVWNGGYVDALVVAPSTGYIGIGGVTTPTASLHVQGDGLFTGTLWTGNLIVTGTTSTVNSNNLSVKDAIIELATGQNGSSPLLDSGFIINRGLGGSGSTANVGFIWKEDSDEFVLIGTGNTASVTTVAISNYENLRLKGLYASSSLLYNNLNLSYLSGTSSDILLVSSTGSVGKTSSNVFLSNNYFAQNGNSFGATAVLGTNDNYQLHIKTNNTTRIWVKETGDVGIGAIPYYAKLDISSTTLGTNSLLAFRTADGTYNPRVVISHITSINSQILQFDSSYSTGTGYANFIFLNGNVGIGTFSPSHKLSVVGDIRSTNKLISDNGSNVGVVEFGQIATIASSFAAYSSLTFNMHNGAGYSDVLKIQGNGSVGIGTMTPHTSSKLDVNGHIRVNGYIASTTYQLVISNNFTGSWAAIAAAGINMGDWFTPTSYGQIRVGNYDFYVYRTNTTSLLTIINTTGNVGIGIDTPSYKLDVVSGTSISARFDGRVIGVTAVNSNEFITLGQLASSASNYFLQNGNSFGATAVLGTNDNQALQFETNGTTRISIGLTGATRFINNTDSNFTEINQRFISFSRNNGSSIGGSIDGTSDNTLTVYGRSAIYFIQGGNSYRQLELTDVKTKIRNTTTVSTVEFANDSDVNILTLRNDGRLHFGSSGLGNSPVIYTSPDEGSNIDATARKLAFIAQDGNTGTNFSFILNNPTTLSTGTLNNIVTRASVTNTTGNSVINQFVVNPTLSLNGDYNGILRGFYYNPLVSGTASTYTHRAIETTNGNIVFNGGSVSIGSSDMLSKLFVKSNTINATNSNIWLQNTNSTTLLKINDDGMLLFGASSSYFGILGRSVELNTNTFGQYGTNPTFFLYSTSGLAPTIQFGNGSRTFNITDNNQIKQLEIGRFGNTNIANFNYNSGTISYYSYGTISTNLTPNIDYNLTSVANNSSLTLSSVLITPTYISGTFANINTVAHHINIATQSNISNIYFYKSDYANINAFSVFRTAGNNIFLRFGMSGASAYIGHNGTGDHFGLGGTNRTWHLQTQFIFNTAETTISSSRVQVVGDLHLRSALTASGNAILIENANSTPLLTVKNTNDILISNALLKSYVVNNIGTGLNTIATYSGIIYQGGFVNYHISSLTNSITGQMMISYNTASNILNYTEVTSVDIGDTSAVNVYATMSNTDINIVLSINSGTWNAKTFINAL